MKRDNRTSRGDNEIGGAVSGPQFVQYFGPVLDALRSLGGSARPAAVTAEVAEALRVPNDVQEELLASGTPRFQNQVAWARFYLVRAGLIDSSLRGIWSLTEEGQNTILSSAHALDLFRQVHAIFETKRGSPSPGPDETDESDDAVEPTLRHRSVLLETIQKLSPGGFERFCQRLLLESGFEDVVVTGRSGDGGIDGHGVLNMNPFVNFKVLFQCKRYQDGGAVTPSHVRDFRGAMQGRTDKGIIITTGRFSIEARREADRAGAPPVELVDGEKLVKMLETLGLGLVPVPAFDVDREFFKKYE